MFEEKIPAPFLQYAADILADTAHGLTGPNIVRVTAAHAVEHDVRLRHPAYPFEAANKRAALYENLLGFSGPQQYRILKELCDHPSLSNSRNPKLNELRTRLVTRYRHLAQEDAAAAINETLIEETRHWLQDHPQALSLYNGALEKFTHGVFLRNLLDDLRLALEKLLCGVFGNDKSLENQISFIGAFIKQRGGSKELANMFVKLVDYYSSYQNNYIKHDDAVIEEEIEFIFEITSSFMKHIIRLSAKSALESKP